LVGYKVDCLYIDVLGLSATDLPMLSFLADKLGAKVFATMQQIRTHTTVAAPTTNVTITQKFKGSLEVDCCCTIKIV